MKKYDDIVNDKSIYALSGFELIFMLVRTLGMYFVIGIIFYRDIFWAIALSGLAIVYIPAEVKLIKHKKKSTLNVQFKDFLYFLSSNLNAGKSLESAIRECNEQLGKIYISKKGLIIKEVDIMVRKLDMNYSAEKVVREFSERSSIEDVENFSEVISISKKWGGNMVDICRNACSVISDKIDIMHDIEVKISQKKFEEKVLSIMPFAIVFMLSIISADYMIPLYKGIGGKLIISIALILFELSHFISKKIVSIEV